MKNNGYKYNHFLQKGFVKNFAKNGEVKWKKYKTEEGGVFHINNTPNKDQPIAQEYFHSLDVEKGMNTLESQGLQVVRKIAFEANQKDEISLSRKELLRAKEEGLVRHIGVSNFNISQIERIKEETGVYPEYNQIICSVKARLNQLEKFCKDKGIVLMGYSSLKPFYNNLPNPLFTFDSKQREFIEELSKKYNTSPAMILLAYSKQNGYIILARSSSPQRTKDNFKILEFEISQDDLKKLDKMNTYNDENFEEENKSLLAKEMFEESVYKVGARISEESDNKYREYVYKKLWKKGII